MATRNSTRPKSGHLRSVPSTDPEAFQAGVEQLQAFDASPLGKALADTEEEVSVAVAMMDCATRSLERDDGNGVDHETRVLAFALERLAGALEALDVAHSAGARAFRQPVARGEK